jgi:hypothetical protein
MGANWKSSTPCSRAADQDRISMGCVQVGLVGQVIGQWS